MAPKKTGDAGDDGLEIGKAEVRLGDSDAYELGAEVGGHFITFASIQGEQVRSNVANKQAQADAASQES